MSYKVVETQHGTTEPAKVIAEFPTRHEALIASAKAMKAHLMELPSAGLSAKQLFEHWLANGKGYRIDPEDSPQPFSDIDYTRLFVLRLTNDYSHPLFVEVSTVDALRTAGGVQSPPRNWKFWVKAPATYEGDGLDALIVSATGFLYDDMSRQSMEADGSSLKLLSMTFRTIAEHEARVAFQADQSAMVYFVQNDGSFGKNMPTNPLLAKA